MVDHIAILNKEYKALDNILNGSKTIESRWYKSKFPPWNKVNEEDTIYFKESGKEIVCKATVTRVLQFVELNEDKVNMILKQYGNDIKIGSKKYTDWYEEKKYCLLVFFKDVEKIKKPFKVDKSAFGTGTAWMVVKDIESIRIKE